MSSPLRVCFPDLYAIYEDKNVSVAECAHVEWEIFFRRMLGTREFEEWTQLQRLLRETAISPVDDVISWGVSANKLFSSSSLYKFLTNGGVSNKLAQKIWKCRVTLKIRIFIWQAFQNRFQT
jgi:hypothetical protein